eukprot:GHVP01050461.1.p1 GENE.GHVP01050461.1~~GHVP01050461.1.p1  ORF type:complete len:493 (+),score=80.87 GHVP01050461.1:23-1501(+)
MDQTLTEAFELSWRNRDLLIDPLQQKIRRCIFNLINTPDDEGLLEDIQVTGGPTVASPNQLVDIHTKTRKTAKQSARRVLDTSFRRINPTLNFSTQGRVGFAKEGENSSFIKKFGHSALVQPNKVSPIKFVKEIHLLRKKELDDSNKNVIFTDPIWSMDLPFGYDCSCVLPFFPAKKENLETEENYHFFFLICRSSDPTKSILSTEFLLLVSLEDGIPIFGPFTIPSLEGIITAVVAPRSDNDRHYPRCFVTSEAFGAVVSFDLTMESNSDHYYACLIEPPCIFDLSGLLNSTENIIPKLINRNLVEGRSLDYSNISEVTIFKISTSCCILLVHRNRGNSYVLRTSKCEYFYSVDGVQMDSLEIPPENLVPRLQRICHLKSAYSSFDSTSHQNITKTLPSNLIDVLSYCLALAAVLGDESTWQIILPRLSEALLQCDDFGRSFFSKENPIGPFRYLCFTEQEVKNLLLCVPLDKRMTQFLVKFKDQHHHLMH